MPFHMYDNKDMHAQDSHQNQVSIDPFFFLDHYCIYEQTLSYTHDKKHHLTRFHLYNIVNYQAHSTVHDRIQKNHLFLAFFPFDYLHLPMNYQLIYHFVSFNYLQYDHFHLNHL